MCISMGFGFLFVGVFQDEFLVVFPVQCSISHVGVHCGCPLHQPTALTPSTAGANPPHPLVTPKSTPAFQPPCLLNANSHLTQVFRYMNVNIA